MSIYAVKQGWQIVRIVRMPAFRALSRETQQGILKNMAKETAKGIAVRRGIGFVIGTVIDPYNRFFVPASHGVLISHSEAATKVYDADIDASWNTAKTALQVGAATQLDPVGMYTTLATEGISRIRKAAGPKKEPVAVFLAKNAPTKL